MTVRRRADPPGPGVDRSGQAVVDPTANVIALSEAATKRQDDLREAERRYNDLRSDHQKEMAGLRAAHQKEIESKESSRLDSIRQVDREDAAKTTAASNLAITTLAKQTTDLATTLQDQVRATAQAAETRRSADMSEVNKRVSALELASSATAGKQQVSDPQLAELVSEVRALRKTTTTTEGVKKGAGELWGYIVGALATGAMLYRLFTK